MSQSVFLVLLVVVAALSFDFTNGFHDTANAMFSPIVAGLAALAATFLAFRITARSPQEGTARGYKLGQIGSASMVSLAHGTNDAQKTMGVITLALISGGLLGDDAGVPIWVIVSCAIVIGAGTYLGGWRVIRTLGKGLTEITAPRGFAAETCSSAVILVSSHFGFPLSTTQVCSGSIMGTGAARRLSDVRWGVAGRMVLAWLVTLPGSAAIAGFANLAARGIGGVPGTLVIALACAGFAAGIWLLSRRNAITPDNVNAPIPAGARSPLAVQEA